MLFLKPPGSIHERALLFASWFGILLGRGGPVLKVGGLLGGGGAEAGRGDVVVETLYLLVKLVLLIASNMRFTSTHPFLKLNSILS